jgi:predicted nucleic acid-binding protein
VIVLDASAMIDLLLDTPPSAGVVAGRLEQHDGDAHVPHLIDAEVGQVLRRYVLSREVTLARARRAVGRLAELPLSRYPHGPFLPRALTLLRNLTVSDALYVALAEALDAPLITGDGALARAARRHVSVVALPTGH